MLVHLFNRKSTFPSMLVGGRVIGCSKWVGEFFLLFFLFFPFGFFVQNIHIIKILLLSYLNSMKICFMNNVKNFKVKKFILFSWTLEIKQEFSCKKMRNNTHECVWLTSNIKYVGLFFSSSFAYLIIFFFNFCFIFWGIYLMMP